MKKILVFMLIAAMLGVTACGNGNNDENTDVNANAEVTSADDINEAEVESAEDPHAGWTRLIGEVYIPNLPFEDWGGDNQDNISCFTVYIKSHNSAAFHAYAQSLADFGYTLEQTESYSYRGTDPEGRSIYLTDHENGQMQIAVYY